MRKLVLTGVLAAGTFLGLSGAAQPAQAGCLAGAAVGGVAGHFVGRGHSLLGAAAGCAVGHHEAAVQRRENERAYDGNRYNNDSRYNSDNR